MEASRVRYEIAYDKTKQTVIVYPQWRGTRPNYHVIGEYTPDNPQADFDEYRGDLGEAVRDALKRVGELDPYPFKIIVTPLNGDDEFVAKEWGGPLARVPVEDQVPVSENKTVAEARKEELEKAEPVPHTTQVTNEIQEEDKKVTKKKKK